jgi:hypothetical protein
MQFSYERTRRKISLRNLFVAPLTVVVGPFDVFSSFMFDSSLTVDIEQDDDHTAALFDSDVVTFDAFDTDNVLDTGGCRLSICLRSISDDGKVNVDMSLL